MTDANLFHPAAAAAVAVDDDPAVPASSRSGAPGSAPRGSAPCGSMPSDDEARWQAVCRRDPAADGAFFYSVRTTGVFCRPSCPSRRARRENVAFHADAAAAIAAGFRPCRRCRPGEPSLAQRQAALVVDACRRIAQTDPSDAPPGLDALAAAAGLSPFHFQRLFKAVTGLTPKGYAVARREGRLRDALAAGARVTEAIYAAGFGSSGAAYAGSARALGMAPSRYRAGGDGVAIRYALGRSTLGAVLVAATGTGVCAILLGDADAPGRLVADLAARFPKASLQAGDADFDAKVAAAVRLVEVPGSAFALPLDVRGTVFQQRVWTALREIPRGSTASYGEIAARIGSPGAARAVATACAANPVAIAIPCHRVVGRDGALSGYRWGVARKRALLDREADDEASSRRDGEA